MTGAKDCGVRVTVAIVRARSLLAIMAYGEAYSSGGSTELPLNSWSGRHTVRGLGSGPSREDACGDMPSGGFVDNKL